MEHDIPFGNSNRENGPTFSDFPLFLGIFQWDEPTKRISFTAEPKIPEILTKGKAPTLSSHFFLYFVFGGACVTNLVVFFLCYRSSNSLCFSESLNLNYENTLFTT